MNVAEILHKTVEEYPETRAIIDTRHRKAAIATFAELELAATRVAALLRQNGIQPGDVVLVMLPLSLEWYVAAIAIFRLGAIALLLDPSTHKDEIDRCCILCSPKAAILTTKLHLFRFFSPPFRKISLKFIVGFPFPGAISWKKANTLQPHSEIEPCTPETPAAIASIRSSVGEPKATQYTHHFLTAQLRSLSQCLQAIPGEIDLTTQPLFGLVNLTAGVTCTIPKLKVKKAAGIEGKHLLSPMQAYKTTRITASKEILTALVDRCIQQREILSNLNKIFIAGVPIFTSSLNQLYQIAPQAQIVALYGDSETAAIASLSRHEIEPIDVETMQKGGGLLVGKPDPHLELKILLDRWGSAIAPYTPDAFAASFQPVGEVGEIAISGDRVICGYLNELGSDRTKFIVGDRRWHRTGDAGYLDSQGRLWLLGRCSDRIEDKFGTIYPLTVECAIDYHPEVKNVTFFYFKYQRTLAIEMARKSRTTPTSPQRSLALVLDSLAWANIEAIRIVDRLPTTSANSQEIDRPTLERMLENDNISL